MYNDKITNIYDVIFPFFSQGTEGKYALLKPSRVNSTDPPFTIDQSLDMSLLNLVQRILPVCANFSQVISFVEDKFSFEYGLVNHALAGAMKTLVKVRQPGM